VWESSKTRAMAIGGKMFYKKGEKLIKYQGEVKTGERGERAWKNASIDCGDEGLKKKSQEKKKKWTGKKWGRGKSKEIRG